MTEFDEDVGRIRNSNNRFIDFNEGFGIFDVNQFGYLETNIPKDSLSNEINIAFLGDSYVESFQVFKRHHFLFHLEENLKELSKAVISNKADMGIAVDPDVDRLAFIDENGEMFGEEYTLVACADYILSKKEGNSVSNLSSTLALSKITEKYGGEYFASAVGEVNVVRLMKLKNAIIGGEGNGGVILPELHYGRDAIVGIALFLSLLAEKKISVSELKKTYPQYYFSKNKITIDAKIDVDKLFCQISKKYLDFNPLTIDGVKINFENSWVHLRKSNTEPIIRIYSEAVSKNIANKLSEKFIEELKSLIRG